jgi:hypothetical protein
MKAAEPKICNNNNENLSCFWGNTSQTTKVKTKSRTIQQCVEFDKSDPLTGITGWL